MQKPCHDRIDPTCPTCQIAELRRALEALAKAHVAAVQEREREREREHESPRMPAATSMPWWIVPHLIHPYYPTLPMLPDNDWFPYRTYTTNTTGDLLPETIGASTGGKA